MFCIKCVLCINFSHPEAKWYEYITYRLISSRIANCFKLTATLSYLYEMWWCWEAFFWERISSVSSTTWEFVFQLKRNGKEIEKKLPVFFHSNQERTLAADQVGRRRAKRDANRRKTWRSSRWDWTEETNYTFPAKNVAPTYFICGASLITLPEEVLFSESVFWIYAARKPCIHEKCAYEEALQH